MKKILIIDDDPDIHTVLQLLLKREGYRVAAAVEEVDIYREVYGFSPDLILLDVLLSGLDGRTVCQRLKTDSATAGIPVIMFSAHPGVQKNLGECKPDDFLPKPFLVTDLLRKIEQHLSRKEQETV